MKNVGVLAILCGALALCAPAWGLTYTWQDDPLNDATGGSKWQGYGIGYAIDNGKLNFQIRTNLPPWGGWGYDSYAYTHFSPGDLYINIGGRFQDGTGEAFGLGFTNHANVVQQAYSGTWDPVVKGGLYTGAVFADGTYEGYESYLLSHGITPEPGDGNLSDGKNSYPTLIMGYTDEVLGAGAVSWACNTTDPWAYDITGYVDLAAIGLDAGESFQLAWGPECGNDLVAVEGTNPVPEPSTMFLLAGGLIAIGAVRRRRRMA